MVQQKEMEMPVWSIAPALMLITLFYFVAFDNYSLTEWFLGNGIVGLGIGLFYISSSVKKRLNKNG